jgi:hypothetical protein
MSQIHLIDELSEISGVRFRKEKRPGIFPLLIGALEDLDLVAFESLEYFLDMDESTYGTDEAGDIRYLIYNNSFAGAQIIRQMEQLELLFL